MAFISTYHQSNAMRARIRNKKFTPALLWAPQG